jgi:hypothetical protein
VQADTNARDQDAVARTEPERGTDRGRNRDCTLRGTQTEERGGRDRSPRGRLGRMSWGQKTARGGTG